MMYELVGYCDKYWERSLHCRCSYDEPEEEVVATFDTLEQAESYVEESLLAAAKRPYFYPDLSRNVYRFRKDSCLRNFDDYEIREASEHFPPPHNPTVKS